MADPARASSDQLLEGILQGKVPRQVRMFAAQGLLPVSREEILRLQVVLSADPDPELAAEATSSLQAEPAETIAAWVGEQPLQPVELDLLARVRREEEVWSAAAAHPNVSDETLRVLARHGTPLVQDIIITNQVRVLGCLELLEDLQQNPQASQVVLRRVREFEEEFIEKLAAGEEEEAPAVHGPTLEQALAALKAIGAHIPAENELPYPRPHDPELEEEVRRTGISAYEKILRMGIKDQIMTGMKGTREERQILVNSRKRLVYKAVLASPKLTNMEVERYASSRSVAEEVLRIIASKHSWLRLYPVVLALVLNPKTPVQVGLKLLPKLNPRDQLKVSRDRNIHMAIRRRAGEFHDRRNR